MRETHFESALQPRSYIHGRVQSSTVDRQYSFERKWQNHSIEYLMDVSTRMFLPMIPYMCTLAAFRWMTPCWRWENKDERESDWRKIIEQNGSEKHTYTYKSKINYNSVNFKRIPADVSVFTVPTGGGQRPISTYTHTRRWWMTVREWNEEKLPSPKLSIAFVYISCKCTRIRYEERYPVTDGWRCVCVSFSTSCSSLYGTQRH